MENTDENHFLINVDNKKKFGLRGDDEVKYADVKPGGDGMTIMVRIFGNADAMIQSPFIIFKNVDRNYPNFELRDNVPGVFYRFSPKKWIDNTVIQLWKGKPCAFPKLRNARKRTLFMDNCAGHKLSEGLTENLNLINTEIKFLPENSTNLQQPADSFIIQKIKLSWAKRWEEYKARFI